MIVAFDGNVYSGKTTLAEALARKINANIVKEYSKYFDENYKKRKTKKDYFDIQQEYFLIDQKRKLSLLNSKINLVDRSFISLFANIWAIYKAGIDIRKETIREFTLLLREDKIIVPTFFVNVECPYTLAKKRFIFGKSSNKNTAEYLIRKDYFYFVRQFNKRIFNTLPFLQIDTTKTINENLNKIISFWNGNLVKPLTKDELIKKIRVALFDKDNS